MWSSHIVVHCSRRHFDEKKIFSEQHFCDFHWLLHNVHRASPNRLYHSGDLANEWCTNTRPLTNSTRRTVTCGISIHLTNGRLGARSWNYAYGLWLLSPLPLPPPLPIITQLATIAIIIISSNICLFIFECRFGNRFEGMAIEIRLSICSLLMIFWHDCPINRH